MNDDADSVSHGILDAVLPQMFAPVSTRICDGLWLVDCDISDAWMEFRAAEDPQSAMRLLETVAEEGVTIPPDLLPWVKRAISAYLQAEGVKGRGRIASTQRLHRKAVSRTIWLMESEGLTRSEATDKVAKQLHAEGHTVSAKTIEQKWWKEDPGFKNSEKQRLRELADLARNNGWLAKGGRST